MKMGALGSKGWDKGTLTGETIILNWLTKTCQTPAAGSWQAEWSMENHKDVIYPWLVFTLKVVSPW